MDKGLKIVLKIIGSGVKLGFSVVGLLFTGLEMLKTLSLVTTVPGWFSLWLVLIVFGVFTLGYVLCQLLALFFRRYAVAGTSKRVSIKVGDVLRQKKGSILIGINDELAHSKEQVGKASLQGQLIDRYGEDWMKDVCENFKRKCPLKEGEKVYPIGTAFSADSPDEKYSFVFLVISHLGGNGCPESTEAKIGQALEALFSEKATFRCRNNRLYAPLIGSGITALTVPRDQMARIMAFHFIHNQRKSMAVHRLIITFRPHSIDDMQPVELMSDIAEMCRYCKDCFGCYTLSEQGCSGNCPAMQLPTDFKAKIVGSFSGEATISE